jgi:hypothetical protein
MTAQDEEWPNIGSRVERLTLFSDAIFAFAMTLLAVNIRVPEIAQDLVGSQLNVELANLLPKFIGYALSFLISANYADMVYLIAIILVLVLRPTGIRHHSAG